jgi:hypothetical protein
MLAFGVVSFNEGAAKSLCDFTRRESDMPTELPLSQQA